MDKLNSFRTYSHADRMLNTFRSAQKRSNRSDCYGASDTIRNCWRWIAYTYGIDLTGIQPVRGCEVDVVKHMESGDMQSAIKVLKYIESEVLYGRYRFHTTT